MRTQGSLSDACKLLVEIRVSVKFDFLGISFSLNMNRRMSMVLMSCSSCFNQYMISSKSTIDLHLRSC